jgi:hypothetical protein
MLASKQKPVTAQILRISASLRGACNNTSQVTAAEQCHITPEQGFVLTNAGWGCRWRVW